MMEADMVYSDVRFIKTRETATEVTSNTFAPDETTYSETKMSTTKSPTESVGPQTAVCNGGSKVTSYKLTIGLLAALLTAAVIALVLISYIHFQTMERLNQLTAENRKLTETCSQETSPTEGPKTCPAFVNTTKPCSNCPDGWEEFEGQCYDFSDIKLKWEEARERCQQQGADLVQVSSEKEQEFLTDRVRPMMRGDNDLFWIGLTDSVTEDTWLWVDGSPLDQGLTFWYSSEPNNYHGEDSVRGEDCVRLGDRGGKINCWFDRACSHPERSICEKPGQRGHLICAEM